MRWKRARRSDNVEQSSGGGGGGMRFGGGSLGIGGIVLVVVVGLLFGKNPGEILQMIGNMAGGGGTTSSAPQTTPVEKNEQTDFVSAVLGSTEDVWGAMFKAGGQQYPAPTLVLFNGGVRSACGAASSAMGPFYCPGDRQVYLDLDFFREMETKFRASGDFARAYVIAHEVGHHVQNVTGVMQQVRQLAERGQPMEGAQGLSVRQELQADCYAGIWAKQAQQQLDWLDDGDVESALNAATQIGDDALQKRSQGYVVPDSFTHGSSAQRVRWFRAGFQNGNMQDCDTFKTNQL